jgi:hypothetical protein
VARRGQSLSKTARLLWLVVAVAVAVWLMLLLVGVLAG